MKLELRFDGTDTFITVSAETVNERRLLGMALGESVNRVITGKIILPKGCSKYEVGGFDVLIHPPIDGDIN
jgi:hypothetical protein